MNPKSYYAIFGLFESKLLEDPLVVKISEKYFDQKLQIIHNFFVYEFQNDSFSRFGAIKKIDRGGVNFPPPPGAFRVNPKSPGL